MKRRRTKRPVDTWGEMEAFAVVCVKDWSRVVPILRSTRLLSSEVII